MVSTTTSTPCANQRKPASPRHVPHANISVKRGHRTPSPRQSWAAADWDKHDSHAVTEIQEYAHDPMCVWPTVSPDDSIPPHGQPHVYGPPPQHAQPDSTPVRYEHSLMQSSAAGTPCSTSFQFSPPESANRSAEGGSDAEQSKSTSPSSASPSSMQDNRPNIFTALGAGRLDPFSVYCKQDLPFYVHGVLDHCLQHVICSFTLASKPVDLDALKSYIMGHAMRDPITWYAIVLAGVTHYIFSRGEFGVPNEIRMLRLSYKTQAMIEIRKQIEQQNGHVSEAAMYAITTLAVHGGADFDKGGVSRDRIQEAKALGKANALNYYSAIETEWEHWDVFIRLMRQRGGGPTQAHSGDNGGFPVSPGPGCLTATDVVIAWRNLRCPEFPLATSTDKIIHLQGLDRDGPGATLMQKLLSGFPVLPRNNIHSRRITTLLQKVRTLILDFDQYQRGAAPDFDIRMLYWTRLMLLHDLLLLPDLQASDNPLDLIYELCRNGLLAFNQLVLVPVVASNRMPEKILAQMIPLLERCTQTLHGRTLDREHPSLFLWAVVVAGMLGMEHYLSHADSSLLDKVSAFFDRVALKAEKGSWPTVAGILRTFLWLDSECEGPGRRYWNYACLWLADRSRNAALAEG